MKFFFEKLTIVLLFLLINSVAFADNPEKKSAELASMEKYIDVLQRSSHEVDPTGVAFSTLKVSDEIDPTTATISSLKNSDDSGSYWSDFFETYVLDWLKELLGL